MQTDDELLSMPKSKEQLFEEYCLEKNGFTIYRGFDVDMDGHQEPYLSLENVQIPTGNEAGDMYEIEPREPSNEEVMLFYFAEEFYNMAKKFEEENKRAEIRMKELTERWNREHFID